MWAFRLWILSNTLQSQQRTWVRAGRRWAEGPWRQRAGCVGASGDSAGAHLSHSLQGKAPWPWPCPGGSGVRLGAALGLVVMMPCPLQISISVLNSGVGRRWRLFLGLQVVCRRGRNDIRVPTFHPSEGDAFLCRGPFPPRLGGQ